MVAGDADDVSPLGLSPGPAGGHAAVPVGSAASGHPVAVALRAGHGVELDFDALAEHRV